MKRDHKYNIGNVTFYGSLAESAIGTTDEEWGYYKLVDSVSDQIAEYMEKNSISKSDLAKRLGTSRAFITKLLAGDTNMTLKTISKVLYHLDARPEIKIIPSDDNIRWFGVIQNKDVHHPTKSWGMDGEKPINVFTANIKQIVVA